MTKLERVRPGVRARLKHIEFRCPVNGCLLATIYWIPRKPTAEEINEHRQRLSRIQPAGKTDTEFPETGPYLYVGRTAGGGV
jgi:hypothetical protein